MKIKIAILVFGALIFSNAHAQYGEVIDSLITYVDQNEGDTTKVDAMNRLAVELRRNDPFLGMDYGQQALELAEKLKYKKGIRGAYNSIGTSYFMMGYYEQALEYDKKALELSISLGDQKSIAHSYYAMGVTYRKLGKYPESLESELKALAIHENQHDTLEIATSMTNIAIIHTNMGDFDKALEYTNQAIDLQKLINDTEGIAASMITLGNIYFYINKLDEALDAYSQALEIGRERNDMRTISLSLGNMAGIYASQENYEEALKTYQTALELDKQTGNRSGMARSYNWIGGIYFRTNQYDLAKENLHKSLEIATELNDLEQMEFIHMVWTSLDSAQGNFESALGHFRASVSYRDSLVNKANRERIIQQQMQYEFDKKQALALAERQQQEALMQAEINQQKAARNGLIIGLVAVLLFVIVLYRQRQKIKIGKARSDELLLNILPHEVAEELKAKGESEAKDFDNVTVLFTDFMGFTQTAEQLTAKELVSEINTCFKAFDEIMEKHQLEKIKTIGDAYMAAGGLHVPRISEPKDVVKAAIEMQSFMLKHKADRNAKNLPAFDMRVGIHTGPVVAGIVGVKKFQYDIWGDTVNTASRIESNGEAGKVNISQATYELLKDDQEFAFESRGKIEAKGKGEIEMWFVSVKSD